MAEPVKQYAIYGMGSKQVNLELNLPKNNYSLEWMDPLNGKKEKKITINHPGGKARIESPGYQEDFGLRIKGIR